MSLEQYIERRFSDENTILIGIMNGIIDEYVAGGYRLTVRQLYYQLVARDFVPNTEKSYKRITSIVNDAKLAGLMDWDAIEDRTREFIRRPRWTSPAELMRAAAESFHMDMWSTQPRRVFVIVEKEALAGVLSRACSAYDVPLLAARGYPSGTVLREFTMTDLDPAIDAKQRIVVLHLGDHDPSGIDMSRDLKERFGMFLYGYDGARLEETQFIRIALTMDQIEEQEPPPNPAKTTDARFESYRARYGTESWELDALKPEYLDNLVREHISKNINMQKWRARKAEIDDARKSLSKIADELEQTDSDD